MKPSTVELSSVAAFLRQHTHDIRNHLNGLELEATLLAELTSVPAEVELAARMRRQIRGLAGELKALSGKFAGSETRRAPLVARELLLIWQEQAVALGFAAQRWTTTLGEEKVDVDVAALGEVLRELLVNAKDFTGTEGVTATGSRAGESVVFELHEPKTEPLDPGKWGTEPFTSAKRGGYGLGLWHAAQTVAASGGEITRAFLPSGKLVTTLTFPVV